MKVTMKDLSKLLIGAPAMLGAITFCNIIAPISFMDLPTNVFKTIRVTKIYDITRTGHDKSGNDVDYKVKVIQVDINGKREVIEIFENAEGFGGGKDITSGGWWSGSSGDIGVALFGLPGTLVASPFILLSKLLFLPLEQTIGMNRHAAIFWLKIKNQVKDLDSEAYELLKRFLKQ